MCLTIVETRALKGAGNISRLKESGKANKSHGISKGAERRANTSMNGIENTMAITANQVDGEISARSTEIGSHKGSTMVVASWARDSGKNIEKKLVIKSMLAILNSAAGLICWIIPAKLAGYIPRPQPKTIGANKNIAGFE